MRSGIASLTLATMVAGGPGVAASPAAAQLNSRSATVVMVAHLSETATVRWQVRAAPTQAQQPGHTAELIFFQSTWQFGVGQSVTAECQLVGAPADEAALLELRTADSPSDSYVSAFFPRPPVTRVPLLHHFDPQGGRQVYVNGLLVFGVEKSASEPRILRVTVTAL